MDQSVTFRKRVYTLCHKMSVNDSYEIWTELQHCRGTGDWYGYESLVSKGNLWANFLWTVAYRGSVSLLKVA